MCLLYMHEDLSWDPQNSHKKLGVVVHICHSSAGMKSWSCLARESNQISELQVQRETLSPQTLRSTAEEDAQYWCLRSPWMATYVYNHTSMYIQHTDANKHTHKKGIPFTWGIEATDLQASDLPKLSHLQMFGSHRAIECKIQKGYLTAKSDGVGI